VTSCTGTGDCSLWNGTYNLQFDPPTVSVGPLESKLTPSMMLSIAPSPSRERHTFAFRIAPGDVPRALEVYGVDGRTIWRASLAGRVSGIQVMTWDGTTTDRGWAPAAVYFARLVTRRGTSTRRFVRL